MFKIKIKGSESSKRLFTNFIYLVILQGSNYILPLLSIPYLFKHLDVEKFGLVNFSFALIQYFIMLTDFGYQLYATKLIAESREDEKCIQDIFNSVMTSKLVIFCFGFLILFSAVMIIPSFRHYWFLYILSYGMVLGNVLFPVWFFQGMEKMKFITWLSISIKLIAIVPLFFFVKQPTDYLYVPMFNTLSYLLCGIVSLYLLRKNFNIHFRFSKVSAVIHSLKESSLYFLSRVSVSLYTTSNTFALGLFAGVTAVGYYSVAEKMYLAMQSVYGPLNTAIYPYMAKTKNVKLFKKILIVAMIFNLAVIATLYLNADLLFEIVFGNHVEQSIKVFRLFLMACIVIIPSIMIGYPFLGALGYGKFTNQSVIFPSILHISSLFILVLLNKFNIYTVAGMVIVTEALVFISRVYGIIKYNLFSNIYSYTGILPRIRKFTKRN